MNLHFVNSEIIQFRLLLIIKEMMTKIKNILIPSSSSTVFKNGVAFFWNACIKDIIKNIDSTVTYLL